jgi:hypothetical protein
MSAAEQLERPAFRQFADCEWCRTTFPIKAPGQRFCQDACRYKARESQRCTSPEYRIKNRQRCAAWAAEKRNVKERNPWLLGQPIYGAHLPGGFLEMHINQPLRWPIELRNVRGLHGALTGLTGPHHPTDPRFAIVPWHTGVGWGVYMADDALLTQFAGTRHAVRLWDHGRELHFGGKIRLKAPHVAKRGHRKIRIDAITPVCTRTMQSRVTYQRASGPNLLSTLCAWLPRRLSVEFGPDDGRLEIVENDSHPDAVHAGGKYGAIGGWTGSIVVDCNAPVEWLLRCAEVVGLGGRCAFGFGRIRVTNAD